MKLIFHVGLPKCGSTSIQNSLFEDSDNLLKNGVLYKPEDGTFRSHYSLAMQSRSTGLNEDFKTRLSKQIDAAILANIKLLVVSSEEFVYVAETEAQASKFSKAIKTIIDEKNIECELVIILRDPRKFMRSYMLQKVANGDPIVDSGLPHFFEFFIKIIRRFVAMKLPTKILSLDQISDGPGLLKYFYTNILMLPDYEVVERKDNVLARRTFVTESITGQICSMIAHMSGNHVNSSYVDAERERIREYIDISSKNPTVGMFLHRLEMEYSNVFNRIIESAVEHTSEIDFNFWNDLNSNSITQFDGKTDST